MAYLNTPNAALIAADVSTTVISVMRREPVTKRQVSGTSEKSTSCLQSMRLERGSAEKAAETSVMPAYAASGQKNAGASKRSCRTTSTAIQQTTATASSTCAMAIENCSAAATPMIATAP